LLCDTTRTHPNVLPDGDSTWPEVVHQLVDQLQINHGIGVGVEAKVLLVVACLGFRLGFRLGLVLGFGLGLGVRVRDRV
jgi:ABC-type nitrate/sulfonate/bicarbonate transport system permease component